MDIFNKIEEFSYRIADKIGQGDSEDDVELYEYSIFMILSNGFTILCGFILSLLLGYPISYITCIITYCSLRTVSGGQHCDSFQKCFFVSNIIIIICCIIANLTLDVSEITLALAIFSSIQIIPICPKPSTNSPSRGESEDRRFRKKFVIRVTFLSILSIIFMLLDWNLLSSCINSGILVLCFVLTDFGEYIIDKLTN